MSSFIEEERSAYASDLARNCVTGQEFALSNNKNDCIYACLESVKISQRIENKDRFENVRVGV